MEHLDLSTPPETVLVVVAHPDDIDFGTAGTVAALTAAGSTVHYALATSGEAGPPEDADRIELKALREQEQRSAAAAVGVEEVRFLGFPDGHVVADLALRRAISRVIRQVRPQLVISKSPERRWDRIYASHPDHLAAGEAAIAAVYPDARNPFAHLELAAEGLEAWSVPEVWVMGGTATGPDRFVDITDVFDRKLAALRAHASQTAHMDGLEEMLRGWLGERARAAGLPEGRLAEAFRVVTTR
jgi:LmbE family N-acetylglucosaminyl deacetylase